MFVREAFAGLGAEPITPEVVLSVYHYKMACQRKLFGIVTLSNYFGLVSNTGKRLRNAIAL